MTDSDATEEMEEIRERKIEQLRSLDEGADEPIHVDGGDQLEDVFANHPLVLVDFWADWCGPCKMIEPVVETLAADTDATVAKVDVDANQALAQNYGVRGIPALFLVHDGEVVERMTGVQEEGHLRSLIDEYA